MTITENHIKTYTDRAYKHTEMVRYKGKVIALAMDDQRRIYYSVLDLDSADEQTSPLDVNYWLSNPKELDFPSELAQVGYGIIDSTPMPIVKKGSRAEAERGTLQPEEIDPFLSSTARLTSDSPFQALSDGKYIYIFRQSINLTDSDIVFKRYADGSPVTDSDDNKVPVVNDTLLVDRFILAGTDLLPKREVRYKRSRNKYRAKSTKDSLGAQDMEKKPFFEPTHELDFVRNLQGGRFSVLLLPTQIAGIQRWQIFTHNSQTGLIDSFNVERFKDGLFNTKGTQFFTSPNPDYQNSVFERQPGTCPFTGQDLIPIVTKSGYAESCLAFDGQSTYVTMGASLLSNQKTFTIEGWIKANSLDKDRISLFGQNDVVEFGLNSNQLFIWTQSGGSLACDYPRDGQWHHVALIADGTNLSLCIDGQQVVTGGNSVDHYGTSSEPFSIGAGVFDGGSKGVFDGEIDEIRLWTRARSQDEIKADLNYRLEGNEPGLAGYWQFDEGAGNTLHDRTDNANHGQIQGNPQWVKSEAPIGDRLAMSRMSFKLHGRTIASGISAILYHQQEKAATGYDQQEKPLKKNARVMLAIGTGDDQNTEGKNYIGVLDFAVSREGKLGQVPDNISLPILSSDDLETASSNETLDRISDGENQIQTLQGEIKQLENDIKQVNQRIPAIDPELTQITSRIQSLQQEIGKTSNLRYKVSTYTGDVSGGGTDANVYVTLKGSLRDSREFEIDSSGNNFETGDWDYFGPFELGEIGTLQRVRIRHDNAGLGSAWYLGKVIVDIYQGGTHLEKLEFRCMSWLADHYRDRTLSPNNNSKLRDRVQIQNDIDQNDHQKNTLQNEKSTLIARKNEYEGSKGSKQNELGDKQKELTVMKAKQGQAVPFPMSFVHVDPLGLTTSGGLLGFAYTKDTPQLFESATGKLALYFRGVDDQFFATYYDTNTKKAQSLLPADTGNITLTARNAEPEQDQTSISVSDGTSPDYCTVVIQNTATDITETWNSVPREVEQFANVFNGNASEKVFIGSLVKDVFGIVTALTLEKPVQRVLNPGETLLVGQTKVQVDSTVQRDATEIPIVSATIEADLNTSVYFLSYDYQLQASANKPNYSLQNGSLQFFVFPGDAKGNVQNGTASSSGTTVSCQWVPQSPGKALAFDGQDDYVGIQGSFNDFSPSVASALQFTGNDYIKCGNSVNLQNQSFTVECWAKRGSISGAHQFIMCQGSKVDNHGLHVGFRNNNTFTLAFYGNDLSTPSTYTDTEWHHWSCTYSSATKKRNIYCDGKLVASNTATGHYQGTGDLYIGQRFDGTSQLNGELCEVRVWNYERTQTEIQADMDRPLQGSESGLRGYWRFNTDIAQDYSGNGSDGTYYGNPQIVASSPVKLPNVSAEEEIDFPTQLAKSDADGDLTLEVWVNPSAVTDTTRVIHHHSPNSKYTLGLKPEGDGYSCFMGIDSQFKQTQSQLPLNQWQHLSVAYNQSYALDFKGSAYLSCEHNPTLDISQDLTIEVFLLVKDFHQPQGILSKGQLGDGTEQSVPYSLYIDTDGKIAFAFEDKDGSSNVYKSSSSLSPGEFYKIAVTRAAQTETKNEGTQENPNVKVNQWADIRFYIDQQEQGYFAYEGKDPGGSNQPLEIGKVYRGSDEDLYQGILSEIRLYNTALKPENLGTKIQGNEQGLISWWRFEENEGNVAYDSKSTNHAVIKGAKWVKTPDPKGSTLFFYQNGSPIELEHMTEVAWGEAQFTLGGNHNGGLQECFGGTMEEVRIWKVARTQEQVQDNLFGRLKGEKDALIANYTFDSERDAELQDHSLLGNHLPLGKGNNEPTMVLSTAPISDDIAQVRSALGGVKTYFHDVIHCCPAVQEYGDLQYDADGNLMGVHKRCYGYIKDGQWMLLTGYKVGDLVTEWIGQVQANPQIIGYIEGAPPVPSENLTSTSLKLGEFEDYNGASAVELEEADSINYIYSASAESGFDTAIELLVGVGIDTEATAGLGFTTKVADVNSYGGVKTTVEYSNSQLSESSVSYGRNTTKTSRLELRGAWEQAGSEINHAVGRRFLPSNLGFALVQSDTMDVFALRLTHNNALVSYRMQPNPDIPKDWNIITFPLNNTYSKQGTLDGKVGVKEDGSVQCDPHYPNATTYGQYSYFKPIEAYSLKKQIERERQELEAYYQQYSSAAGAAQELVASDVPRQMAARNLVNTYVWTADGGFFSESTEVMESVQESNTSSYSFQGMGGFAGELNASIMGVATHWELDALFGGHVETVKTKEKETERSFNLAVEVDGDNDLQLYVNTDAEREKYHGRINEGGAAYDENGNPVLRPGKVDAYRFMSFYLEPTKDNFEDFFNKVVDPIWLDQSNQPNAVALRQANQGDKKPKCWRIMHRVTFVSRILPEITADNAPPVAKAMKSAHLESNYELIKKLEPFVKNKTHDYITFADGVRDTLKTYLPELQPHETEIIEYAALYFGVVSN